MADPGEEELDEETRRQRYVQSDISPEEYDRIAWHIVGSHFAERGLVRQQLDSFDTFLEHDIQRIVDDEFPAVTVVQELDYKKLKHDEQPVRRQRLLHTIITTILLVPCPVVSRLSCENMVRFISDECHMEVRASVPVQAPKLGR